MESDRKWLRLINPPRSPSISIRSNVIPEDLWVKEIFKRLPTKCLCRFQCVCKSWKSLISSNFFLKLRYSFTSSITPANMKPYILECEKSYVIYRPQENDLVEHLRQELYFPFQFRCVCDKNDQFACVSVTHGVVCVGVIHGVVCISYSLDSSFDTTVLWNPAIHKYVTLPWIPFPLDVEIVVPDDVDIDEFNQMIRFDSSAIGFGYNKSKEEFKVVRVWILDDSVESYEKTLLPTYAVYSSQEGYWRTGTIDSLKSYELFQRSCFINGIIHWLVYPPNDDRRVKSVLMFDCENEKFTTMRLPEEMFSQPAHALLMAEILEYAGMLSVLLDSYMSNLEQPLELWVMEKHGVTTSWKKLYKIQYNLELNLNEIDMFDPSFEKLAPYGPKQWAKFHSVTWRYYEILSQHVFEESLFLIDNPEAKSYTEKEIVQI